VVVSSGLTVHTFHIFSFASNDLFQMILLNWFHTNDWTYLVRGRDCSSQSCCCCCCCCCCISIIFSECPILFRSFPDISFELRLNSLGTSTFTIDPDCLITNNYLPILRSKLERFDNGKNVFASTERPSLFDRLARRLVVDAQSLIRLIDFHIWTVSHKTK